MKNLAEFKKQAKIGVKLNSIFHKEFSHREESGKVVYKDILKEPREVSIVQSNAIALKTKKSDGTITDSWFAFPKAKECDFVDGKMIVYEDEDKKDKVLTYWFD
jgi:hypothetical protein